MLVKELKPQVRSQIVSKSASHRTATRLSRIIVITITVWRYENVIV